MGNCCTRGNDAVPEKAKRSNIDDRKNNDLQPLIDTSDVTAETNSTDHEGGEVSLEMSLVVEHILNMTSFSLIDAWKKVDIDNKEEIDIERDLYKIFLYFVEEYIKKKTGKLTVGTRYKQRAEGLANEIADHFQFILANYEYEGGSTISQDFYLENFQQYLADPQPIARSPDPQEMQSTYTMTESMEILTHQPIVTPIIEEYNEPFDMLSFISTSSTIKEDPGFNADHTVTLLREALEAPKKKRGEQVGEILSQLTESQRTAVREAFVGPKNQSLQSALEDNFSGDLLLVLSELCRSSAYNDAEWIEKSRNKLNINTSVINEILMSRTNTQLAEIKQAYKERFGRDLLESLLQSFNDTGSYGSLLKLVLTEDARILRKELNPKDLKEKKIRDDAKLLYHILETTKGKLNKLKVIEMLCHRSWFHIAILCKEYGKKSKYDLKTMIERKFGKNSKSGDALQKIIDVSRNRHSFFAQLLFQSMKGMSTDDSILIRVIVGRSCIDLGEIAAEFSQKYGNGKTLLQFIKSNARKGTYRNILLRIAAIGADAMLDGLDEPDEDSLNSPNGGTYTTDDDMKVLESHHSISFSQSTVDGDEKDRPRQTWDEFVSSSPTMLAKADFNADQMAEELLSVLNDKKKKKDAKRMLIQSLTRINNRQRQDLKKAFQENPANERAQELTEATQDTLRKGKTMIVMLGLLQRPAEFNCFWVKQAIKSKKLDLLIEILVSCSNYEIKKLKDHYEQTENSDLLQDINKSMLGNKKTAQGLIRKMLEAKRPELTHPDKKLCKIHLTEMNKLLKKKNQKECKQFFAKLFVENSYSQIKYEINKFNTASELSLVTIVKKIMGNGYSGIILENIIKISTNRYGYFCEKLRESMKGMSTSEHILIRILIGRAEKDLGDIVQYFAEETYGEGKTLKQWLEQTLKGSFLTSLLQIAGIYEAGDGDDVDLEDFESQTESDMLAMSNDTSGSGYAGSYGQAQPKAVSMALVASKSAALPAHSTVPLKAKLPHTRSTADVIDSGSDEVRSPSPRLSEIDEDEAHKPLPADKSPRIVITTPSMIEEENKVQAAQKTYDPYDINEAEFGAFIIEKVNEKTAQRLMQHLKQGSKGKANDESDDDVIGGKQCIHVLLFACVLFLKYKEKVEKRAEVQIDKKKLKKSLMPSYNWIMENKLTDNATLQKSKYKILGKWLKEYYQVKHE